MDCSARIDGKHIKLPDRQEITLCEAVTAFVTGEAVDAMWQMLYSEPADGESIARSQVFIERLHSEAYAGRIRLRALRNGDHRSDGHKQIDSLYFSEPRGFRWDLDEIWVRGLTPERPKFRASGAFQRDWYDVHLNKKDFEDLLANFEISAASANDIRELIEQPIFKTGMPGRPTSKHLLLPMLERRLGSGDSGISTMQLARELAQELKEAFPNAPSMTTKTIYNAILPHRRRSLS